MCKDTHGVCICGHTIHAHKPCGSSDQDTNLCTDCAYNSKITFIKAWHKFKLDNLKYLEGMANEQS